ncbi:hypothetical protein Tco_0915767, partial [Tanacetum coccineum]
EELLGDVAARMVSLNGQEARNTNKQCVNDEVAGKNTSMHIRMPTRILQNPNSLFEGAADYGGSTYDHTYSLAEEDHIGVSSYIGRVAPTSIVAPMVINASHDDVFSATYNPNSVSTVAPTSFGDFYTMDPSSDHVMDIKEHAWSFNHAGPNNNSNNLSSYGAAYPKPFDGSLLMNETNLGVNANSGDT